MNQLDQLKAFTTAVADTGNFMQLAAFAPRDATANPSLTLKAVRASFRNVGQISALAGCNLLTISPELPAQLQASQAPLSRQLDPANALTDLAEVHHNEASFRRALNEDAMASDKLAEGVHAFAADAVKLDARIEALRK